MGKQIGIIFLKIIDYWLKTLSSFIKGALGEENGKCLSFFFFFKKHIMIFWI